MSVRTVRRRSTRLAISLGAVTLTAASVALPPSGASAEGSAEGAADGAWVGTWSAAPVIPGESGDAFEGFEDATVRNVIHTSIGGDRVRVRLTNLYGEEALTVDAATVAERDEGAGLVEGTVSDLTFDGAESTTIPVGEEVTSDPVELEVDAGGDLAISTYFEDATGPVTQHPVASSTNYSSTDGNQADTVEADPYDGAAESWFVVDGVDVHNEAPAGSVVAFGDSITDGVGSTTDENARWPDNLARRLQELPASDQLGVLNQGISGNRVLNDADVRGRSALERFGNDVLSQTGVRSVVITEGINDIRHMQGTDGEKLTAEMLIDGLEKLAEDAHDEGLTVVGGTLLPYGGSSLYSEEGEEIRQEVNDWIRTSDAYDAVVDFDELTRDPDEPTQLAPEFDSGDHLHPSDEGYRAMADAIPLGELS